MANVTLSLILEKIASKDKDFRYMATSDLANELAKESFKFEEYMSSLEKQVAQVVITQLEDQSGDISGLAVKCLGLLVNKVREERLAEIVAALGDKMGPASKKEAQRDVSALGLKAVVAELNPRRAHTLVSVAVPRLIEGLKAEAPDIVINSLDLLAEITSRYGAALPDQSALQAALLPELDRDRAGVRKRAIQCLAALAAGLPQPSLDSLCSVVLGKLEGGLKPEVARTYMQALGAISKSVGYKFGAHLGRAVPLVIRHLRSAPEGDDELREQCLQALETFVVQCPQDARSHLPQILPAALEFLRYDPNYADDDMDEGEGDDGSGMEEDEEMSEDDYSDDEDMSWKVRRAAAKAVSAVITRYPHMLAEVYPEVSPALVSRFREREESVKGDIFHAYVDLVRQIGLAARRREDAGVVALLRGDMPAVTRQLSRQLKQSSVKTKVGVFRVLLELVAVAPDAVGAQAKDLTPGVQAALADKTSTGSNLKMQALQFLSSAMAANQPAVFQGSAAALAPPVFAAAGERYYKVTAEALRVCEQLVRIIRPDPTQPLQAGLQGLVAPLYQCVLARLSAPDQDQEVKECAIVCTAAAVAALGDVLGASDVNQVGELAEEFAAMPVSRARKRAKREEQPAQPPPPPPAAAASAAGAAPPLEVLKALLDRLRNETTRLTAVKAFTTISSSPLNVDMSSVLAPVLSELTGFLRKANRQLRQAALAALEAIVRKDGAGVGPAVLQAAVEESAGLVSDADLAVTSLALKFAVTVLRAQPAAAGAVCDKVLPQAMALVKSPLLQGAALESLQAFFNALVASGAPGAPSFADLRDALREAGSAGDATKSAQHAAAQCVAVLCTAAGQDQVNQSVQRLQGTLQDKSAGTNRHRFALLVLGELGRRADLTAFPALPDVLTSAVGSDADGISDAASLALGGVAAGNLSVYLPLLLRHVSGAAASPRQLYPLLKALGEVITSVAHPGQTRQTMTPEQQQQVLDLLLSNTEADEECRAVVAECLGALGLLAPDTVLGALRGALGAPSPSARAVAVAAARHLLTERPHAALDAVLPGAMPLLLERMGDEDRHVRKAAVQLLTTAVHNKPGLVVPHLPSTLPLLYQQTEVNKELIRVVDLGPFKHTIDDGLELRKASFECMDTLLERCGDRVEPETFISHLLHGLKDHYDVKMPCHLMLSKLSTTAPGQLLAVLDKLVDPLTATLTAKVKSDAVKQEVDRNEDMLRSCLRAVDSLARIPAAPSVPAFKTFMDTLVLGPALKERYHSVREERKEAEGGDSSAF